MIFKLRSNRYGVGSCFRPLIRGFFFYAKENNIKDPGTLQPFPSPHSGILFLFDEIPDTYYCQCLHCFRPLIRGFFFYLWDICGEIATDKEEFPSPHSGILFLLSDTVS